MEVHYTERYASVSDADKEKAARKFEKVHRILSADRDLEAHVIFSKNGSGVEAEVTLHALHHTLVVTDTNGDAFTALNHALAKLEKQARKNKDKLIETRRRQRQKGRMAPAVEALLPETETPSETGPQVVTGAVLWPFVMAMMDRLRERLDRRDATFA